MLHILKNNIFRTVFAGLLLILAFTIALLPKVFADQSMYAFLGFTYWTHDYQEDGSINVTQVLYNYEATKYTSISGHFLFSDFTPDCAQYFTFDSIEAGAGIPADATITIDNTAGTFSFVSDAGMDLSLDDEVLRYNYTLSSQAPSGTVCEVSAQLDYSAMVDGDIVDYSDTDGYGVFRALQYTVDRDEENITYNEDEIYKTYGDENFINPLTTIDDLHGPITYSSNDETVATVDSETGEVHIMGAGVTIITATIPQWYSFLGASASYTLNVAPKLVSITNVSVPDKTYDGTTDTEVGTVTLSETGLARDVDYTVSGALDSANVGTDRIATVTVTLIGDAANRYVLDSNTFEVNDITISPYSITSANVNLEYYEASYDGTEKEPGVTVKIGDFTVDPNEYNIGYDENIGPGTAYVIVTAKNNMNITSSAQKTFQIIDGREVLEISGIASPQVIAYTGLPVELEGALTVGENTGGITADDLIVAWFDSDGETTIDQPTEVGSYIVKYLYSDENYVGILSVSFEIEKAVSPQPVEMEGFSIEAGKTLSEIEGTRTTGFDWDDESTIVTAGRNGYAATYTYNNDTTNYTTLQLEVPVYGLSVIDIDAETNTENGEIIIPASIIEGESFTIRFVSHEGYRLLRVIINEVDVTSQVENNELVWIAGSENINIVATFVEETADETDDETIAVPDTGRFTNTKVSTTSYISAVIASVLVAVATMILVGGKFARNKIDFGKK